MPARSHDHDPPQFPFRIPFCPNLVRLVVFLLRIVTAHQIIILRGRYPLHL